MSLLFIFGAKQYAKALWHLCDEKNINVNTRTNPVKIYLNKQEATFENLDIQGETCTTL